MSTPELDALEVSFKELVARMFMSLRRLQLENQALRAERDTEVKTELDGLLVLVDGSGQVGESPDDLGQLSAREKVAADLVDTTIAEIQEAREIALSVSKEDDDKWRSHPVTWAALRRLAKLVLSLLGKGGVVT